MKKILRLALVACALFVASLGFFQPAHAASLTSHAVADATPTPDFSGSTTDCSSATLQGSGNPGGDCVEVPLSSVLNSDTLNQVYDLANYATNAVACGNDLQDVHERWTGVQTILFLGPDFWNDCGAAEGQDILSVIQEAVPFVVEVLSQ